MSKFVLNISGAVLLFATGAFAQAPSLEYEVKAAFLHNFVNFIDWPPRAFSSPAAPVKMCIFGENPFGGVLERMAQSESTGGRNRLVQTTESIDELKTCHIVFIPSSEESRAVTILGGLRGASILTVGESSTFLQSGGIINFAIERNRVRFDVNLAKAEENDLKISSKLLRLARTTRTAQVRD